MTDPRPGASRLLHGALTVSSEARAERVFVELFGLSLVKVFEVGPELCAALFGFAGEARARVYAAGEASVEVFVCPGAPAIGRRFEHLCFELADLEDVSARAIALGMEVRRFHKGDKEVVFVRDEDGNLYELKEPA
jgi:catechol 2,3-dioxygenase-like lactoylglutathione lyase family enzyme